MCDRCGRAAVRTYEFGPEALCASCLDEAGGRPFALGI